MGVELSQKRSQISCSNEYRKILHQTLEHKRINQWMEEWKTRFADAKGMELDD